MLLEVALTAVAVAVIVCLWFLQKNDQRKGVNYSQSGAWLLVKKLLAVVVVTVLRRRRKLATLKEAAKSPYKSGDPGFGIKSRTQAELLERPQQLTDDENAVDSMYFNGLDSSGSSVIFRIARRHRRMAEIWLSVNIPGVGSFQSPIHPDTSVYNVDCSDSFSAAGIKFECLEPMKQWKITYNGLMRQGLMGNDAEYSTESFETVHMQMTLIWCAFTDPVDLQTDTHPALVAAAIASERWSLDYFKCLNALQKQCINYQQWGELWGTCQVDSQPELNIRLRGRRSHFFGELDYGTTSHRSIVSSGCLEDGSVIQVSCVSLPGTVSLLQSGFYIVPNAEMFPVTWTDLDVTQFDEMLRPPNQLEFNFKAGGKLFHVKVSVDTSLQYYLHEDWRSVVHEQVSLFEVNGVKGHGVFHITNRHSGGCPLTRVESLPLLCEPTCIESGDNEALALTFSRPGCSSSKLVGGKGCQLALLTQLNSQDFCVPKGFCLTVHALEAHIKSNPKILKAIDDLTSVSCTNPDGLPAACSVVVEHFKTSQLCTVVNNSLVDHLVRVFGDNYSNTSLAVRSSATGEDGTEMSAAGQMDTILGVKGFKHICEAICSCWASTFAFIAVSYRRQYGQPIRLSSGVVIQEMAPAAESGVLFTRHPVTGSPGVMVMNANYGLGESVVSGQCEPDEILISRSWDVKLAVLNKTLGSKKLQIRLKLTGEGTEEATGSKSDKNSFCLSDDVALNLANIGVELEKRFGSPRDIEFAVDADNRIYLLQARPITTIDRESDNYLLNELNSAMCNDQEWITTANLQEVMPNAMTTLTSSVFLRAADSGGQMSCLYDEPKIPNKVFMSWMNQAQFSVMPVVWSCNPYTLTGKKSTTELAIIGRTLDDLTMEDIQTYHGHPSLWRIVKWELKLVPTFTAAINAIPTWTEKLKRLTIVGRSHDSVTELYDDITEHLPLYTEVFKHHIDVSYASAMWNNIMMTIITKNKAAEWTSEHVSDIALLLSKCEDVWSADVPTALDHLVETMKNNGSADKFVHLSTEEAIKWLQSVDSGSAGTAFSDFLTRHGHRCLREYELRESSWAMKPERLAVVLQAMLKSPKPHESINRRATVDDIETQLPSILKSILRWAVPKARRAVGYREMSKSQVTKVSNVLREAYRELANMMLREGRLPDTDLIYFFTHREIGQLLKTRSGRMIARAQRRRQLLPKQMSVRFPLVFTGHPKPIEDFESNGTNGYCSSLKLTGMPVSRGEICGKARVVTSLEGASEIQQDDILIVPYTDIGWSPYFPLIAGLATEIGGLISHGAVIAREYGLPCVVSIAGACKLFKSGDMVLLNGTTGTLEKLNETSLLQIGDNTRA